jgi:hypothetical protein
MKALQILAAITILMGWSLGCGGGNKEQAAQEQNPGERTGSEQAANSPPPEHSTADKPAQEIPKPKPAAPTTRVYTVPAGTELVITLDQALSTDGAKAGQTFTGQTTNAIVVDGKTVVPVGSTVRGEVAVASRASNIGGKARLTLAFQDLVLPSGKTYALSAQSVALEGESTTGGDVEKIVGGAIGGAIVGGILGGKSGAAKGAAVGTAAGTVVAVATKGNDIVLDPGTKLGVLLRTDVGIPVTGSL